MQAYADNLKCIKLPSGYMEKQQFPLVSALHWGIENYPEIKVDTSGFIDTVRASHSGGRIIWS